MKSALVAAVSVAAATVLPVLTASAQDQSTRPAAKATFKNLQGEDVGTATLAATPSGYVLIQVEVNGLEQGERGFHVHETGECDPATEFKSAGGHLAGGKEHGVLVEGGPHPGDMPNQHVGENGVLRADVFNERIKLTDSGDGALFDADGSALMVHSQPDDYTSQPSGEAGGRVACAVIEKVE